MIKLSANETKWSSLLARTSTLILIFQFEYLISGPKSYSGTLEKWAPGDLTLCLAPQACKFESATWLPAL